MNGQSIEPRVEQLLTRVDEVCKETERFLRDEDKGWCKNLKSRYSSSKEAKKKIQVVVKLYEELGDFSSALMGMASTFISTRGFKGFESRRLIMNEVMEALKDDSINMIGICGMAGVGKTTLVKEIAEKAEEKKLFNEVVLVELSQNPDSTDIQGMIAALLGFRFSERNLPDRAREVQKRILSKRVLVILDDVWKKLELKDIGIPFGADHKSCKIVLTSRSEAVCNDMHTQKKITVQVLPEDEAWNLFKEHAGISDEGEGSTNHLQSTQKAVARKCGGLPIAIVSVGKAVKSNGTDETSWDYDLERVQKSICENIDGVFEPLELSYKYLQSEEAKKCFLLCSLFPEDSSIPIEELVTYAIGLKLLQGVTTVGKARESTRLIRDVAISIASSNKQSLMVRLENWPEKDRHHYTAISLRSTVGDVDISVIEALSNLEILSITGFSMKELPKEIGNLAHLRLMYLLKRVISWTLLISLSGKKDRESITELASLPSLVALDIHVQFFRPTDLVFGNNLKKFNITIGRGEHKKFSNPFMLKKRLELWNLNASYLVESGLKMLKSSQILELFDVAGLQSILFDLDEGGFKYLTNLSMARCRDLEYLIYTSSDEVGVRAPRKAFPVLESLNLKNLDNFKGIVHFHHRGRAQLVQKKGGPTLTQLDCLHNLSFVQVMKCSKLESVFTLSMQLFLIPLNGEQDIEASTDEINFSNLKELVLRDLPSMTTFCKGVNAIELPQLNNLKLFKMPKLTSLCDRDSMTTIQLLFDIKSEGSKGRTPFPKLKHLELNDLPLLWCFSDIAHEWELPLVESITVINCPKMTTFSREFIRIPNIEIVLLKCWSTGEKVEGIWADDLNATIRKQIRGAPDME
ncbi:unnamed protein product [Camellia sinensis]